MNPLTEQRLLQVQFHILPKASLLATKLNLADMSALSMLYLNFIFVC